jgi:transglutaminase superfamily protein
MSVKVGQVHFDPRRFTDPTRASQSSLPTDLLHWAHKMILIALQTPRRAAPSNPPKTVTAIALRRTLLDPNRRRATGGAALAYCQSWIELKRGASQAIAWASHMRTGPCRDINQATWAVDRLIRPGRLPGRCLLRSIVLARLLSSGRAEAVVIRLGVRRTAADTIEAHAWVEVDGVPVTPAGDFATAPTTQGSGASMNMKRKHAHCIRVGRPTRPLTRPMAHPIWPTEPTTTGGSAAAPPPSGQDFEAERDWVRSGEPLHRSATAGRAGPTC